MLRSPILLAIKNDLSDHRVKARLREQDWAVVSPGGEGAGSNHGTIDQLIDELFSRQ